MGILSGYWLLHPQQRQNNDNNKNGNETAGTITATATTVVVIGRSMPATAAGTRAEAAIEGLLVMGVARAALAEVTIVFRHCDTSFQFILKMLLFN